MTSQPIVYRDGSQNSLAIFSPETDPKEIIMIFPALGVRASYYEKLGIQLAGAGFLAVSVDWRGHGASSERPRRGLDYGYETYVLDMDEVLDWVGKNWPKLKLTALGHSLGGQIAALHKARFPERLDRIILAASCTLNPRNWPWSFRWKLILAGRLLPFIGNLLGYYPGNKLGFGGREFRSVMRDWGRNTHRGTYRLEGSDFDYEEAFPKQKAEICGVHFSQDNWVNERAVRDLLGKFHPDTQPDFHVIGGFGHFNWAKEPEKLVSLLERLSA